MGQGDSHVRFKVQSWLDCFVYTVNIALETSIVVYTTVAMYWCVGPPMYMDKFNVYC